MSKRDNYHERKDYHDRHSNNNGMNRSERAAHERAQNSGAAKSFQPTDLQKDLGYCMVVHTLNGNGARGAIGDFTTVGCIAERQLDRAIDKADKAANQNTVKRGGGHSGGDKCIISSFTKITYNNPFLQNNSTDALLLLYNSGGMEAVNNALNNNHYDSDLANDHIVQLAGEH